MLKWATTEACAWYGNMEPRRWIVDSSFGMDIWFAIWIQEQHFKVVVYWENVDVTIDLCSTIPILFIWSDDPNIFTGEVESLAKKIHFQPHPFNRNTSPLKTNQNFSKLVHLESFYSVQSGLHCGATKHFWQWHVLLQYFTTEPTAALHIRVLL